MHVEAIDVIRAIAILVVTVVVAQLLKWVVRRWFHRGNCEVGVAELLARFVSYGIVLLGIVYALMALHVQVGPLLGALGVGGLAVALASKGLLEDLFGGFVLQARHPFHRGDEITIGEHEGIVEDINLRTVVMRTHDGERVFIPSSMVLREPIVNLTANDDRRTVLELSVPFDADVAAVCQAISRAVQAAHGVHATPVVLTQLRGVGASGVELAVKFWHGAAVSETHAAVDAATTAALDALASAGSAPEVPQRRLVAAAPSASPSMRELS
jgi:small-conductance mechanosensitive channel